jgi:hypothetical protein
MNRVEIENVSSLSSVKQGERIERICRRKTTYRNGDAAYHDFTSLHIHYEYTTTITTIAATAQQHYEDAGS